MAGAVDASIKFDNYQKPPPGVDKPAACGHIPVEFCDNPTASLRKKTHVQRS
jgi:hypothetical protein